MEISGLPLHPLVVHAAVVLTPVAALLAVLLVLAPGWRWWVRWAAVVSAIGAALSVLVARLSGRALLEDRPFLTSGDSAVRDLLLTHQDRADVLGVAVAVLLLLVVAGFVVLPARTGLVSGRLGHRGRPSVAERRALVLPLQVGLLAAAVVSLVWVVLTGDAGSRAVWGP